MFICIEKDNFSVEKGLFARSNLSLSVEKSCGTYRPPYDWAKLVVAVKRVSDRVLRVDVVIEAEVESFIVVYALQVGRSAEEKEKFYDSVYAVRADIRGRCVMLGDWNGHVGSVRKGYCAHGGFGVGDMNAEGEAILELAASCEMVVVNTWFIKEESKLVTYESGDSRTVVDYILVNEEQRKNMKDAKVIAGEECVTQHKLLVMDWRMKKVKRRKVEGKGKLKLGNVRSNEGKQCFRDEIATLNVEDETVEERWTCLEKGVLKAAEKVCCRSKGGVVKEQAWWWDQRVSDWRRSWHLKGGESRGLKQIGSITSGCERRWLKR
ncbi:uncharacterized protein LOC124456595 [Xenia sp. Carnegie-2017]|uniref:uncharacterized protein LOC124456595 n=1 Tax=Xenia sp. Carnegie-2017 TaxID=2897299 RepID=UPI001F04F60D|nr:uncharacterized protein LOC124456595 [Xenia sp. Carnegie-2017]